MTASLPLAGMVLLSMLATSVILIWQIGLLAALTMVIKQREGLVFLLCLPVMTPILFIGLLVIQQAIYAIDNTVLLQVLALLLLIYSAVTPIVSRSIIKQTFE